MNVNESWQLRLQLPKAGEHVPVQRSASKLRNPPLDSIQPRSVGRREVKEDCWLIGHPPDDFLSFVSAQIIQRDLQVFVLGCLPLDLLQEGKKLRGSGPFLDATNDFARQNIEGLQRGCCSIALVIVSATSDVSRRKRQPRLSAIERLNLGFLVNTQHQAIVWRVHIQADNVYPFIGKMRIIADLNDSESARLQVCRFSNFTNLPSGDASVLRHQRDAPMSGLVRNMARHQRENAVHDLCVNDRGALQPCLVKPAFRSRFDKFCLPLVNYLARDALSGSHIHHRHLRTEPE